MRGASRDSLFLAMAGLFGAMQLLSTATILWVTTRQTPVAAPVVVYAPERPVSAVQPAAIALEAPKPAGARLRNAEAQLTQHRATSPERDRDQVSPDVLRLTLQQALRALARPAPSSDVDVTWDSPEDYPDALPALQGQGLGIAGSIRDRLALRTATWDGAEEDPDAYDTAPPLVEELASLLEGGLGPGDGLGLGGGLGADLLARLQSVGGGLGGAGGLSALAEADGALQNLQDRLANRRGGDANLAELLGQEDEVLTQRQRRALLLVGLLAAERRREPAAP